MRYREGQEVDPDNPYPESTQMMMEMAYWMSIPIGLLLLWIGIKGRVMWLKIWSVGLMALGVGFGYYAYFEPDRNLAKPSRCHLTILECASCQPLVNAPSPWARSPNGF